MVCWSDRRRNDKFGVLIVLTYYFFREQFFLDAHQWNHGIIKMDNGITQFSIIVNTESSGRVAEHSMLMEISNILSIRVYEP